MKTFRFPLDRALHLRRTQLEVERTNLQTLRNSLEQLELRVIETYAQADAIRHTVATQAFLLAGEVATLPDYQRGARQRLTNLHQEKHELLGKLQEQQRRTIEAEKRVELLDQLRAKRFSSWRDQMQREQENFAGDAYLARWSVSG